MLIWGVLHFSPTGVKHTIKDMVSRSKSGSGGWHFLQKTGFDPLEGLAYCHLCLIYV